MQSIGHIDSQVTTLKSSSQKSQWHRTPVIKIIIIIIIIIPQCLSTGPRPLPKLVIHTARSSLSDLKLKHLLVSLRDTSCLRLHRRLFVPSKFPAITCFKTQFLRKMCPIQLDCHRFIACKMLFYQAKSYKLGNVRIRNIMEGWLQQQRSGKQRA